MQKSHGLRALVPVALALLLSVPVTATAEDAPIPVTEQELLAPGGWGPKDGKLVELAGSKFHDYYGGSVRLTPPAGANGPAALNNRLLLNTDKHPELVPLADLLSGFRTAAGPLDRKGRSNVKIQGYARSDDANGRFIEVTSVTKTPDDLEAFKARLETLDKADVDGRMKLAEEAKKRADDYGIDNLRDWVRQTYDGALDLKRASLAKGDVKTAVDVALKYKNLAGSTNKAIQLLGEVVADPTTSDADRASAVKLLEGELGAVLHREHWVSRDDFKSALGFVSRTDAAGRVHWLRRERIEFDALVDLQRKAINNDPNLRKLLGSQYEEAANKGEPVKGMYKQEIVRTKGFGFPAFVDRFAEKAGTSDLVWDQWIMPDGSRFYFMNGTMFEFKKKDEALPKN
jgi:hypothetical protein